jgi:hypothetical protein
VISPRLVERVAAGAAGVAAADCVGAHVIEHRGGRQRTVLEYRFEGGLRLFAKRYPQCEDATTSYDVLRLLEEQGFGPGSPHRVPEPLGCFAEWGVVVIRAAPGRCMTSLAEHPERWEEGLRAAAGWLARLHSLTVDSEATGEDQLQGLFRLAQRATGAAARHPSVADLLVALIEELAARAAGVAESGSRAQTHGRYHAGHVFITPETVTVIDLDRASVADPAKDLGEFLHRVRTHARRAGLGDVAAERTTLAFLDEYAARGVFVPGALAYYWSYSILSTLLRVLELDHAKWEKRLQFYRAQFDSVPQRAHALGQLAAAEAVS